MGHLALGEESVREKLWRREKMGRRQKMGRREVMRHQQKLRRWAKRRAKQELNARYVFQLASLIWSQKASPLTGQSRTRSWYFERFFIEFASPRSVWRFWCPCSPPRKITPVLTSNEICQNKSFESAPTRFCRQTRIYLSVLNTSVFHAGVLLDKILHDRTIRDNKDWILDPRMQNEMPGVPFTGSKYCATNKMLRHRPVQQLCIQRMDSTARERWTVVNIPNLMLSPWISFFENS